MNFVCNTPIFNKITIPNIHFRGTEARTSVAFTPVNDSYSTNPLYNNFADKNTITSIAKSNPKIMDILKSHNLRLEVNTEELENLRRGHLMDTRVTAAKIHSALPRELKDEINSQDLQEAAMLHDYGKVLIPDKILNKDGKLNDKEREIMELHSELGYELLKSRGVRPNVLNMIKYHHQKPDGSGYPKLDSDYTPDLGAQILSAADKYSALREARSYKDAMSREEALAIIRQDVDKGITPPEIYKALERVV